MAVTYGRVALVTGSSRGLGAVIARRLARDGVAVAVNGRPGDDHVATVSHRIRDDGGAAEGFCRAVLPGMQARRYGRIVHIDSEVADRPPPGRSAYATAKSAQIGLTRSWAREVAPFGITVNTVAPGFIPVERHANVPDEVVQAYIASVPAGRMGTPADIAATVSFLASDDAGFITGQRIVVDGGRHLGS